MKIINKSKNPLPSYQTTGASGLDICAACEEDIIVEPMQRVLVPTGLFIAIPNGYEGQVRARSGLSIKNGITLVNCVGTIDSDYRGELKIPIINLGNSSFTIRYGDRIAQLIITKYEKVELEVVNDLDSSDRGDSGFGSTGV